MKIKKLDNWPGPKAKKIIEKAEEFYATTTVESDFVPSPNKRGKGVYLYDIDGNRFLDFCSGVGVANCGYGNKLIERAISDFLQKSGRLQYIHHDFHNPESVIFAEILAREVKAALGTDDDYKVFLSNSGTEANEVGLKLAFAFRPERKKVIAFQGAFHGRTLGSLPLMSNPHFRKDYPMAFEVTRLTFPRRRCPETIAAFKKELTELESSADSYNSLVIELLQGQGGIYLAAHEAMRLIADFCFRHKIFLHVDEVQSGYGRTGAFLVTECFSFLEPDIIALGKGIANGLPVAATVFKKYLDWKELGRHASTYGGNALGSVAAIATLKYIKKHCLLEKTASLGIILRNYLRDELCRQFPGIVVNPRGLGLMQAVDFVDLDGRPNRELCLRVIKRAYLHGLILIDAGEAGIRIMPPLVIKEEELIEGLERLKKAISEEVNK